MHQWERYGERSVTCGLSNIYKAPKMLNWVSSKPKWVFEPLWETLPQWLTEMCHITQVLGQKNQKLRPYDNHFVKHNFPFPYFFCNGFVTEWHLFDSPIPMAPFLKPPAQTAGPRFLLYDFKVVITWSLALYPSSISSSLWWWSSHPHHTSGPHPILHQSGPLMRLDSDQSPLDYSYY